MSTCSALKKDGNSCTYKGKYTVDGKHYCGVHAPTKPKESRDDTSDQKVHNATIGKVSNAIVKERRDVDFGQSCDTRRDDERETMSLSILQEYFNYSDDDQPDEFDAESISVSDEESSVDES